MKQFNKPNEELTDQELQELIMSDRTLASIVEPHTVIGQVYKRYYAKLATLQKDNWISVDERLPERGQNILFIMKSRDENYNGRVLGGRFNGYDFSTPGFGCDASHWKPIDLSDLPWLK